MHSGSESSRHKCTEIILKRGRNQHFSQFFAIASHRAELKLEAELLLEAEEASRKEEE